MADVCSLKRDLHGALVRNHYLMPRLKDRICTFAFLTEVRTGTCWVPRLDQLHRAFCADKPTEKFIREEVIRLIKANFNRLDATAQPKFARLAKYLKKYSASKDFLLEIVAAVTRGNHPFFERGYKAPPRVHAPLIPPVVFDNSDGFFNGLPHTSSKNPRVSHRMLTVEQRNDRARAKLAARIKRASDALSAYDVAEAKRAAKRKEREAALDSDDEEVTPTGLQMPDLADSDSDGLEFVN